MILNKTRANNLVAIIFIKIIKKSCYNSCVKEKAEQVMRKIILKDNITTSIENKHKSPETSALIHP